MSRIEDILDEAFQVNLTMKESLPVTNGILDRDELLNRKKRLLEFSMDYLKDSFVTVKQYFPDLETDMSEVDLSVDFVVITGEQYRRLRKLI